MKMRSRKLAALQKALKPPEIHGDEEGDLLVVGWGSTRGAIEEAVDRVRRDGHARRLGVPALPVAARAGPEARSSRATGA